MVFSLPLARCCLVARAVTKRMVIPMTAPINNNRQAIDWRKNPGARFSTASMYPAKYQARPTIHTSPSAAAARSLK
jgi:hypothetical protein